MIPVENEARNNEVINILKHMKKVNAPPNFEFDLMRRINSGNFIEKYSVHWWEYFFLPSRLIPVATLTFSIVALFYFLNFNSTERDNPFLAQPKIIKSALQAEGKQILQSKTPDYAEASISSSFKINKEGLNFLHIRLNDAEKAKITILKEQIRAYFNKK
jgi:hypothetical protein